MNKISIAIMAFSAGTVGIGGAQAAVVSPTSTIQSRSIGLKEAEMLVCVDALQPVTSQSISKDGFEATVGSTRCQVDNHVIGLNAIFEVYGKYVDGGSSYQMVTVTPQAISINDYGQCAPRDDCYVKYEADVAAYQIAVTKERLLQETRPKPVMINQEEMPANVRTSMTGALAARKKLNAQLWQFRR